MSTWKREIVQKLSIKKKIIFIGVHNRRTDYSHHYQVVSNSVLVDQVYFNTAFEIYRYHQTLCQLQELLVFRKKYNDDKNQVVFLAVSDDNEWIKVLRY